MNRFIGALNAPLARVLCCRVCRWHSTVMPTAAEGLCCCKGRSVAVDELEVLQLQYGFPSAHYLSATLFEILHLSFRKQQAMLLSLKPDKQVRRCVQALIRK